MAAGDTWTITTAVEYQCGPLHPAIAAGAGGSLGNSFVPWGRCEVLSNHQLDDRLSGVRWY
jgi:hypothetical protein